MTGTLEFVMATARAVMTSLAMSYELETGNTFDREEKKLLINLLYTK